MSAPDAAELARRARINARILDRPVADVIAAAVYHGALTERVADTIREELDR